MQHYSNSGERWISDLIHLKEEKLNLVGRSKLIKSFVNSTWEKIGLSEKWDSFQLDDIIEKPGTSKDLARNAKKSTVQLARDKLRELTENEYHKLKAKVDPNLANIPEELTVDPPIFRLGSKNVIRPKPIPPSAIKSLDTLQMLHFHYTANDSILWRSPANNDQFKVDTELKKLHLKEIECLKNQLDKPDKGAFSGYHNPKEMYLNLTFHKEKNVSEILATKFKLYPEPRPNFELDILFTQTVEDLMNSFICENQHVYTKDISHPDAFNKIDKKYLASNVLKARTLFIKDSFFIDPECEDSLKLVKKTMEWCGKHLKKYGPYKICNMKTSKIGDLKLNFGSPFVYIHLGNCEHLISFNNCRFVPKPISLDVYPRRYNMRNLESKFCDIDDDNMTFANWVVIGYDRFPISPFLVCTKCLFSFCYKNDKKTKEGDFKLYPILDIYMSHLYKSELKIY